MDTAQVIDGVVRQVWRGHEPLAPVGGLLVRCRPGKAHCGMMWRDGVLLDPERTPAQPYGIHAVANEVGIPMAAPSQAAGSTQIVTVSIPMPATSSTPVAAQGASFTSSPLASGVAAQTSAPLLSQVAGPLPAVVPTAPQGGLSQPQQPEIWTHAQEVLAEACSRAMAGHQSSRDLIAPRAAAAGASVEEYCAAVLYERAQVHIAILEMAR